MVLEKKIRDILTGDWLEGKSKLIEGNEAKNIVDTLCKEVEDCQIEYKENLQSNLTISNIISALSNTKGGALIFGVRDYDRKPIGFRGDLKKSIEKIRGFLRNYCNPLPEINYIRLIVNENKKYLILSVKKTNIEPISSRGIYYIRNNDETTNVSFDVISKKFPNSQISILNQSFFIYEISEITKIKNHFKISKIQKTIETSISITGFSDSNIKIISGISGSGKTHYSINLLSEFKSKKPIIVLIPKDTANEFNVGKFKWQNFILLWDDLHIYYKKGLGKNIMNFINEFKTQFLNNESFFIVIANYRSEETQILHEEGFFTNHLLKNSSLIKLKMINNNDNILKLINSFLEYYKIKSKLNKDHIDLIYKKILVNPTPGFISSAIYLLKQFFSTKNKDINIIKAIRNLPNNIGNIWNYYFKQIEDNEIKKLLKTIRIIFELNITIQIPITKYIFNHFLDGDKKLFNEKLLSLVEKEWIILHENSIYCWESQLESIPLEILNDINSIDELTKYFIKSQNVNDKERIRALNSLARITIQNNKLYRNNLELALQIYKKSNSIESNVHSLNGIGISNRFISDNLSINELKTKIKYLEISIQYFKKATNKDQTLYIAWSNLGAALHQLAFLQPERRIELFEEEKKCYEKSINIAPNYSIIILNNASFNYNSLSVNKIKDMEQIEKTLIAVIKQSQKALDLLDYANLNHNERIEFTENTMKLQGAVYFDLYNICTKDIKYLNLSEEVTSKILEMNPKSNDAIFLLGEIYFIKGLKQPDTKLLNLSLELAKKAIELGRWTPDVYVLKANSLFILAKKDQKIDLIESCKEIVSNFDEQYRKYPTIFSTQKVYQPWAICLSNLINVDDEKRNTYFEKFIDVMIAQLKVYNSKKIFLALIQGVQNYLLKKHEQKTIIQTIKKFDDLIKEIENPYLYLVRAQLYFSMSDHKNQTKSISDFKKSAFNFILIKEYSIAFEILLKSILYAILFEKISYLTSLIAILILLLHAKKPLDLSQEIKNYYIKINEILVENSERKDLAINKIEKELKICIPPQAINKMLENKTIEEVINLLTEDNNETLSFSKITSVNKWLEISDTLGLKDTEDMNLVRRIIFNKKSPKFSSSNLKIKTISHLIYEK